MPLRKQIRNPYLWRKWYNILKESLHCRRMDPKPSDPLIMKKR